jgi:hypothetical protein
VGLATIVFVESPFCLSLTLTSFIDKALCSALGFLFITALVLSPILMLLLVCCFIVFTGMSISLSTLHQIWSIPSFFPLESHSEQPQPSFVDYDCMYWMMLE